MKSSKFCVALSCALVVLAGCKDDEFIEEVKPIQKGDKIVFGARAGYENNTPGTKTEYSGETYTVNGVTYERVDWVNNDKIAIYCEQAIMATDNKAEYTVVIDGEKSDYKEGTLGETTTVDKYFAYLQEPATGALQWGSNSPADHHFFAIYPAPSTVAEGSVSIEKYTPTAEDTNTSNAEVKISGYIPPTQNPLEFTYTNGNCVAKPDMRFAYMTASAVPDSKTNEVLLNFTPIATAVDIEIVAPAAVEGDLGNAVTEISEILIQSTDGKAINGAFSCYMESNSSSVYPYTVNAEADGESRNTITINLWSKNASGTLVPVSLERGKKLTVTVFMLPVEDLSNLKLTAFAPTAKTATLTGVTLKAHKKHYVKNLTLPQPAAVKGNNWITLLEDNVYLSGLSVPGTGGSFSFNYAGTTDYPEKNYKSQTLTIEQQWNLGIRCFEFTCDRVNYLSGNNNTIENEPIKLNGQSMGYTFSEGIEFLQERLKENPDEFAIVIATYTPDKWYNLFGRLPSTFMSQVQTYWDGVETAFGQIQTSNSTAESPKYHGVALLTPNTTVGDVRGKLMLIARPTSEGEDSETDISDIGADSNNILVIKGWGSLSDKWVRRGYAYNNVYTSDSDNNAEDLIMYSEDPESTFNKLSIPSTPNFTYPTNTGTSVWAQEWRRVSNSDGTADYKYTHTMRWGLTKSFTGWYYWPESLTEKKTNIQTAFQKSINKESNILYINSLCGFYVTGDYAMSFIPYQSHSMLSPTQNGTSLYGGQGGDIEGLSTELNAMFYQYILQKQAEEDIAGPMGIILMDRVGNEAVDGSMYLPSVIISNNFKFALPKKETQTEE